MKSPVKCGHGPWPRAGPWTAVVDLERTIQWWAFERRENLARTVIAPNRPCRLR